MKAPLRIFMLVFLALTFTVGPSYAQSPAGKSYVRGLEYAVEGNFEEAKVEFKKAIEAGRVYGPAERSLEVIEDAINQRMEKEAAIKLFKGLVHGFLVEMEEAIAEFSMAINLDPNYEKFYFYRGVAYEDRGQYDQAIADYSKAIELDPGYVWAYYNRGIIYKHKKQYGFAIVDYSKAIELNPGHVEAYLNRGQAYVENDQYDLAGADFSKAIELDPTHAESYYYRAVSYYYKKEYDKAWEDVHKAQSLGAEVHPGFLEALREASGRDK